MAAKDRSGDPKELDERESLRVSKGTAEAEAWLDTFQHSEAKVTPEQWQLFQQLGPLGHRHALSAYASQWSAMQKEVKGKVAALPEDTPNREREAFRVKAGAFQFGIQVLRL